MYSVVLMMALSSGAEVPAFGGHGCSGSCHGGSVGCHGGGGRGCHGGCHGGSAGCHGGSGGCHGGYAGCHGGSAGCNGGYAGCTGAHAAVGGCSASGCAGGMMAPHGAPPKEMKGPGGAEKIAPPPPAPEKDKEVSVPTPATMVVSLPAEAKLLIDDAATTSTSSLRVFASPSLEPGKDFYYTLRGELVRDGQTILTSQRVKVRAGQETRVQLEFPLTTVALR